MLNHSLVNINVIIGYVCNYYQKARNEELTMNLSGPISLKLHQIAEKVNFISKCD